MGGWLGGSLGGWVGMYGCIYVCLSICMYVCMYKYKYMYICICIVERSKRTCKAIALLQLFSLREFDGSRTQSLKVPRVPPRKDLPQARYKKQRNLLQPCTLGTT